MKRFTMFACLALPLVLALSAFAGDLPHYVNSDGSETIIGGGQSFGKASRDTIQLIGPAAAVKGSFQDGSGSPNWNGWTHYDVTQPTDIRWQASTYFAVTGTYSAWCGADYASCVSGDPAGGYGNNYNEMLEWRGTVANNGLSCSVTVQANLQYDTEPGYDYSWVSYEKFDQPLINVASWDGSGLVAINETFSYAPGDYMGAGSNQVVVLFRVTSDAGWSDGDCSWPTSGACQLDDVVIGLTNGLGYVENFESGTLGAFTVRFPLGVGDFAKIWSGLEDFDPCRTNYTASVAFIDDGIVVPGTGGTPCVNWCYGPSGFIVNTTGGLAGPESFLFNALESPVVDWADDSHNGALLNFDAYMHEDLSTDAPGVFVQWGVRSAVTGDDITAANWEDRNFVYYNPIPAYRRFAEVVTDLFVAGRSEVQVQVTCREYGWVWGYVGNDGYPAPYFDNVRLSTYPVIGPGLATRELEQAQDNFPAIGQVDYANLGNNSVRFDMANNISLATHLRNDPGDSVVFDCVVTRIGAALTGNPVMHYALNPNPLFNAYRSSGLPNVGTVECDSAKNNVGIVVANRFFADLPDEGFFFPGDVLHYFFEASDDLAGDVQTALLPADTTGFYSFDAYNALTYAAGFTVRALPSVKSSTPGDHPEVLFWSDGGTATQNEWHGALANLGLLHGRDYDVYYTKANSSGVGNGLGGRATQFHLEGYNDMLYTSGTASGFTIGNNDYNNEASADAQVLDLWLKQGGKDIFLTGDGLATDLQGSGTATLALLENYMGLSLTSSNLRPLINNQSSPRVLIEGGNPVFSGATVSSWIAYGGCGDINTFDAVEPINTATRIAQFANAAGNPGGYAYSAATLNEIVADDASVISMPYDFQFLFTDADEAKALAELSARARVLSDVLAYFGVDGNPGDVSAVPGAEKFAARNYPNPFNPKTTISYTVAKPGHMTLKIYNVRGELVKTLIDGVVNTSSSIEWDGDNNAGAKVSSGVYFYEARMGNDVVVNKMALVK